jgi:hypothetical protein
MSQRQRKKKRRQAAVEESGRRRAGAGLAGRRASADPSQDAVAPFRRSAPLICLGLIALTVVVYAPLRNYGFISLDDPQYVTNNPYVAHGLTSSGVRWAFAAGESFYWHPLTWISHMLDVQLYGLRPGAHHVTNIVFHVANTVLLFACLYRLTGARGRGAFVAALFAVHPLHVESVAWVAERKDVLSTFFLLLALWTYVDYAGRPRRNRMVVVAVFFGAGLMAKPMVVTLPFVLLLLDYWPLKRAENLRAWIPLVVEKLPLFALAIGSLALTVTVQHAPGAIVALKALPLSDRIGNALVSYVQYIRDAVWPTRLGPFYPFTMPSGLAVAVAGLTLLLATAVAIRVARRAPYVTIGWAWYLGTLVPVIGLVQAGNQGRADRFTYVPLIGLFIIVAWGGHAIVRRWRSGVIALPFAAGITVAACAVMAGVQVRYWKNNVTLWDRTLRVTTGNYRIENLLGVALSDEGKLPEAIEHYANALKIWPEDPEAHNNLGTARIEQGRTDDAIHEFSAAVRVRPYDATFRYNLAVALDAGGRRAEAIRELRTALTMNPLNQQLLHALDVLGGGKQ